MTLENELSVYQNFTNSEKANETKALVCQLIMVYKMKAYNLALSISTENSHRDTIGESMFTL